MPQLTKISTYPLAGGPEVEEFALLASGPAALVSAALTEVGGIPAWSSYLRIFVVDESRARAIRIGSPVPASS